MKKVVCVLLLICMLFIGCTTFAMAAAPVFGNSDIAKWSWSSPTKSWYYLYSDHIELGGGANSMYVGSTSISNIVPGQQYVISGRYAYADSNEYASIQVRFFCYGDNSLSSQIYGPSQTWKPNLTEAWPAVPASYTSFRIAFTMPDLVIAPGFGIQIDSVSGTGAELWMNNLTIESADSYLDAATQNIDSQLKTLKNSLDSLSSQSSSISTSISSLNASNASIKSDLTTLQSDLTSVSADVDTALTDLAVLKQDTASLNNFMSTYYPTFQTELTSINGELDNLATALAALKKSVDDGFKQVGDYLSAITSAIGEGHYEYTDPYYDISFDTLTEALGQLVHDLQHFETNYSTITGLIFNWWESTFSAFSDDVNQGFSEVNTNLVIIQEKLDKLIGSSPNETVPNADGGIGDMVNQEDQIMQGVNGQLGSIGDFDSVMGNANTGSFGESLLAPLAFVRANIESILNIDPQSSSNGLMALCLFSLAFGLCMFILGKKLKGG